MRQDFRKALRNRPDSIMCRLFLEFIAVGEKSALSTFRCYLHSVEIAPMRNR